MKSIVATIVALLTAVLAVEAAGAADAPAVKPPPASASGLSPLARKYAVKREALLKEFAAKRRAMVGAPEWKALPEDRRKARLDALAAEAKKRDERLTAAQDAEERGLKARKDADAAAADQAQRRRMNDIQVQAAQDAARARKGP
jgi:hypothetical protein